MEILRKEETTNIPTPKGGKLKGINLLTSLAISGLLSSCQPAPSERSTPEASKIINQNPLEPIEITNNEIEAENIDEINEIRIGNAHLYFEDGNNLENEKKEEIINQISEAYQLLVNYFGEETVSLPIAYNIPIIILNEDNRRGYEGGAVSWAISFAPDSNYDHPRLSFFSPESLSLDDRCDLRLILHELVHLFLQPPAFFSSAFHEGTTEAIEEILVPRETENRIVYAKYLDTAGLNETLSIPLDYAFPHISMPNTTMNMIARGIWRDLWLNYIRNNDPDFLINFYREISIQRRNGKNAFSREELIAISSSVSPQFNEWYENSAIQLHSINENEPFEIIEAFRITDIDALAFINIRYNLPEYDNNGVITREGSITTALHGTHEARLADYYDPTTFVASVGLEMNEETEEGAYHAIGIPGGQIVSPHLHAFIDGNEIPIH